MKKRYYRFKKFKYINGVRGVISLFLAVLMTPFLTIAMALVEVGRFNSTVSILDEAMGSSSTSTLAHYDEYLHNRWGLMAVSQENDIDALYNMYLAENAGIMGNSMVLNEVFAEGQYPLADADGSAILYNQIIEFSKFNAPTYLVQYFSNIADLIDEIEEAAHIDSLIEQYSVRVEFCQATVDIIENAQVLTQYASSLEQDYSNYDSYYTAFSGAVDDLIEGLGETRPDEEEDPDGAAAYDQAIVILRGNVSIAQSNYSSLIGNMISNLGNYKSKMSECAEPFADMANAVYQYEALEANAETLEAISEAESEGWEAMTGSWESAVSDYSEETVDTVIAGLEVVKGNVDGFNVDYISGDSSSLDTATYYYSVTSLGIASSTSINSYLTAQENALTDDSIKVFIEGVTAFYNSLFNTELFYDPELSACINEEYYLNTFGGLPGDLSGETDSGPLAIMQGIANTLGAVTTFCGSSGVLEKWEALCDICVETYNTLNDLKDFLVGICVNIMNLFTEHDRLYYSTYTAFNLPCRTDYDGEDGDDGFKCMTGYELSELPEQDIIGSNLGTLDDWIALVNTIVSMRENTGDDLTFSGAELEYVLFGSKSELANQLYVFCTLYIFRFVMDIIPVLTNHEVQTLAEMSTVFSPVIIALELFLEPFAETIVLVNGGEINLVDRMIYFTPSGIFEFIQEIVSMDGLTEEQKAALSAEAEETFNIEAQALSNQMNNGNGNVNEGAEGNGGNAQGEGEAGDGGDGAADGEGEAADGNGDNAGNANNDNGDNAGNGNNGNDGNAGNANNGNGDDNNNEIGFLSFNYKEYCFLLLLLTVTDVQQMGRLSNLIQMESLYYYDENDADYTFDLKNSYTFIHAEADVEVNQIMPTLIDSSLFEVTREQYRGY